MAITPQQFEQLKTDLQQRKAQGLPNFNVQQLNEYTNQKFNSKPISTPKTPTSFGQKILNAGTAVSNFLGGKGVADTFGATLAKANIPFADKVLGVPKQTQAGKDIISAEQPSVKETVGSGIQLGANFIPGAGKGLGLLGKIGVGAGTGAAFDVGSQLQDPNKGVSDIRPGVGTAVGAALPVAGATARLGGRVVGRLFKGLGSGLSGVSTETIDKIISNPKMAQLASKKLAVSGNNRVLEQNAKTIINGVSKIKGEASSAYRKGLDSLSDVDIAPEQLKKGFASAMERNKVLVSEDGAIDFSNADFLDEKIQKKAEDLINKVNQQKDLSGTGIRKLMDIVDNSKFKTAPDGDRQAFNAFVGDLKQGLKEGVNNSTDKLNKMNAKYSEDLQLAETVEDIFGNVNFKNLPEVVKASQKLENLFAQKGLAPEVVDNFLERIGVSAKDFKTTEAVRQISAKSSNANSKGLSVGEIMQQTTSAVVTPEMVKNLSIGAGMTKEKVASLINKMNPAARDIVIQTLLPSPEAKKAATPMVTNLAIATGLAKEQLVPFLNSLAPAARNALIQALIQNKQQ